MIGAPETHAHVWTALAAAIPFPAIDPVAIHIGPLPIRWYSLAYIVGLSLGWLYARWIVRQPRLWGERAHPSLTSLDDLLVYCAFGVIVGGRLFHILFYAERDLDGRNLYFVHPEQIFALWNGGMAFHGGLLGVCLAIGFFVWRTRYPLLSVTDLCGATAPIGVFLGRIANFIKPELWGRPTDVAWGVVFPGAGPAPRHPSQLYEAGLEGLLPFFLCYLLARFGGLKRPGLITGVFAAVYGAARIFCEFFREPDASERLDGFLTKGMLYSAPMVAIGLGLILYACRPQRKSA